MRLIRLSVALAIAFYAVPIVAQDTARDGPTYPIAEENFLAMIERRLREKGGSGELRRLQEEAVRRGKQAVLSPRPLDLPPTQTPHTIYYDPTYVLDRNILDGSGKILFAAGTRANPLDIVPMSKRLLFFDGRDARQVQYARRAVVQYGDRLKPVLTGGSFIDLMRVWRRPVYYDQHGVLTERLGITHVPAWAYQEGKRIRIDTVVVK